MPAPYAVLLTPSVSLRLFQLLRHRHSQKRNFHSPYTLPSSVSPKSFACHSYENTGGVEVFFPFWNSPSLWTSPILVLSFHALMNCKFYNSFVLIFMQNDREVPPHVQTFRRSRGADVPTCFTGSRAQGGSPEHIHKPRSRSPRQSRRRGVPRSALQERTFREDAECCKSI
jgi:hypothetical protein